MEEQLLWVCIYIYILNLDLNCLCSFKNQFRLSLSLRLTSQNTIGKSLIPRVTGWCSWSTVWIYYLHIINIYIYIYIYIIIFILYILGFIRYVLDKMIDILYVFKTKTISTLFIQVIKIWIAWVNGFEFNLIFLNSRD